MEIDFLGLNSNTHQDSSKDSTSQDHRWNNGGVETCLSLSTSCSNTEKKWELPREKRIFNPLCNEGLSHYSHGSFSGSGQPDFVLVSRPVFAPPPASTFIYDLNNNHCSRNMSEFSSDQNSLRSFYSSHLAWNKATYASATGFSAEARMNTTGHTPTVAMARKASLARFLEKRLHRMNQTRTPHLMRKPLHLEINGNKKKKRHDGINIQL